jgi:tyrosine-protein kinase Etk/Wzc
MELEQHNYSVEEAQENSLKDVLVKYLYHWKWFVISLFISFILCSIYLRYQTPQYEVVASILIKDDKKGDISSELSAFEDLGILKNNKNIDNEIEILKSRSLMTKVVKELKLNILYFSYGRPIEHERYSNTPIRINILNEDSTKIAQGNWLVIPESDKKFLLKNGIDNETIGTYKFGDTVVTEFGLVTFIFTPFFTNSYLNKSFRVVINPLDVTVSEYIGEIRISPVNKTSNAITVSLRNAVVDKAIDVVDNLIKQHNLDAIEDKNQISKNTANFINERIKYITDELSLVEGEAENFKTKYKLTDVESEAKLFLQSGNTGETGILETNTQMRVAEFMNDYVQKHNSLQELIPTNLGLSDSPLSFQINEYNKLVIERNRILKNSSEKNPTVENLNNQFQKINKRKPK